MPGCRALSVGARSLAWRGLPRPARGFHISARGLVAVGDKIPDVELVEGSPGNKVAIAKELTGRGVVIGVPAAFSECHHA